MFAYVCIFVCMFSSQLYQCMPTQLHIFLLTLHTIYMHGRKQPNESHRLRLGGSVNLNLKIQPVDSTKGWSQLLVTIFTWSPLNLCRLCCPNCFNSASQKQTITRPWPYWSKSNQPNTEITTNVCHHYHRLPLPLDATTVLCTSTAYYNRVSRESQSQQYLLIQIRLVVPQVL